MNTTRTRFSLFGSLDCLWTELFQSETDIKVKDSEVNIYNDGPKLFRITEVMRVVCQCVQNEDR